MSTHHHIHCILYTSRLPTLPLCPSRYFLFRPGSLHSTTATLLCVIHKTLQPVHSTTLHLFHSLSSRSAIHTPPPQSPLSPHLHLDHSTSSLVHAPLWLPQTPPWPQHAPTGTDTALSSCHKYTPVHVPTNTRVSLCLTSVWGSLESLSS